MDKIRPTGAPTQRPLPLAGVVRPLRRYARSLLLAPLLAGIAAYAATFLLTPRYKSTTSFLPPQQQNAAAAALNALGSIGALAGVGGGFRTPADQYVALMESNSVSDRIVQAFELMKVYDVEYRVDARKVLARRVNISVGKKDGLIHVEVEDESPQRALAMASRYIEELRRMTGQLAMTEAQQRRAFFETQLKQTRDALAKAQLDLQASGFSPGALKSEPRAAAESYARLRAEVAAAEVKLQALRTSLVDSAPEVRLQSAALAALRAQLARAEQPSEPGQGPDYVSKYREYKYQEALFEVYARQFELARVDESRESAVIQVVDPPLQAEKRSFPRRGMMAASAAVIAFALVLSWAFLGPNLRAASRS